MSESKRAQFSPGPPEGDPRREVIHGETEKPATRG